MPTVTANSFAVAVKDILQDYDKEVSNVTNETAIEVADKAVKDLKAVRSGKRPWKKFPRSWTKTVETKRYGSVSVTVHLKPPHHRIGHLLEFGHASRGGGRSVGGFHFIEPVANDVETDFENKLTRKIGGI